MGVVPKPCGASGGVLMAARNLILSLTAALLCWLSVASADPAQVNRDRLLGAASEPGQWFSRGRDWTGQFYSPLDRINASNVTRLGFAWEYDAGTRRGRVQRGLEATPIVVDGVMYVSLAWSEVVALDARTGTELWRYDPKADGASDRRACCDVVNRGVAVWQSRVYIATIDGYLAALDAKTGREIWRADTFTDRTRSNTITGAPQVAGHVVVIGNGGSEFGVRGYVSAFDVDSGALRWRFYTVPGDPRRGYEHPELRMAAKTWDANSDWLTGGGGSAWDGMAYDPRLNLVYFGTGNSNPYPTWFRSPQRTDNLFLASILAVNPDTGRLKWYYQTTPGEMWDYDATQPLVLADLKIGGRMRQVLMQANKNGFFYVLDRASGKLLSAKNYVYVNWATGVSLATGRPMVTAQSSYKDKPKLIFPGQVGGHNWHPMSYSPQTGLVYIPAIDTPMLFSTAPSYEYRPGEFNMGAAGAFPPVPDEYRQGAPHTEMRAMLLAWDPVGQRAAWQIPQSSYYNGGVLSTAGELVFQGTSSGHLVVYAARTGQVLKDIEVGTGIMAAPSAYELDGQEYVAVLAGFGGGLQKMFPPGAAARTHRNESRLIVFKLDGGATRVTALLEPPAIPEQRYAVSADADTIAGGKTLYMTHCARCHGGFWEDAASGYPDLKRMSAAAHAAFDSIVIDGALRNAGMASFQDVLSRDQAHAIQAYLQTETNRLIDAAQAAHPTH